MFRRAKFFCIVLLIILVLTSITGFSYEKNLIIVDSSDTSLVQTSPSSLESDKVIWNSSFSANGSVYGIVYSTPTYSFSDIIEGPDYFTAIHNTEGVLFRPGTIEGLVYNSYASSIGPEGDIVVLIGSWEDSQHEVQKTEDFGNLKVLSDTPTNRLKAVEKQGQGKISFHQNIDRKGADINSVVKISKNQISVDSTNFPEFNKSATLELQGLSFEKTPVITMDGELCPEDVCNLKSYINGHLVFDVAHFTNFSSTSNSNLTIWDQTDPEAGSCQKGSGLQVVFFSNYTNKTSGEPINGSGVYCNISFEDTPSKQMQYNASAGVYIYNRSFASAGAFQWNVSCDAQDYEPINLSDTVEIIDDGSSGTYLDTRYSFLAGELTNVLFNDTINALMLDAASGTFTSQIFHTSTYSRWNNISWISGAIGKLPDNQANETEFGDRNIDMTENKLLLHFDNESSYGENSTHFHDFSGNSYNGTWYGDSVPDADSGPTDQGKIDGALKFDGDTDYIMGSISTTKNFTMSAWIRTDTLSDIHGIVGYTDPGGLRQDFYQYNQQMRIFADGKYYATTTSPISETDKWYFVTGTYEEGSTPKVYVNGEEQTLGSSNNIGTYPANEYWIGRIGATGTYYFDGEIDEVAIWNRVLSQEEIQNIYARGAYRVNISVRSCDDPGCDTEEWEQTFTQDSDININDSRYFQYKAEFFTENTDYKPTLYNVTIRYDSLDNKAPSVTLEFPENDTTNTTDKTPDFGFNVTDETAETLQCSLWLNRTTGGTAQQKDSNTTVINGTTTILTPGSPLNNGEYFWWVNCSDSYNTNISEKRVINISVPDSTPPNINLVSPAPDIKETSDNTPEFSFTPTDNKADILSCELWLNATGTVQGYGVDESVNNDTTGVITANTTLANQNYTWWINCSDGTNTNISLKRDIEIYVDSQPPIVTLDMPTYRNSTVNFSSVNFTCSATDDIYLKNTSLYSDYLGTWQFINSSEVEGQSDSASFIVDISWEDQFKNTQYSWNCLVYDNKSKSSWAATNYTFSNWDYGNYSNAHYNYTLKSLVLTDYGLDGSYTSDVFDAGQKAGWKNISWVSEGVYATELPNNKGSNNQVEMDGNILLMHLNDGEGATTFQDTSGENNNGSCTGGSCPVWNSTGKYNGAYMFQGDDYITCGSHDVYNLSSGDHTFEAWIYPTSMASGEYNYIMSIGNNQQGQQSGIGLRDNQIFHSAYSTPIIYSSYSIPSLDQWYHLVVVHESGTDYLYVNGDFKESQDIGIDTGDGKCRIGAHVGDSSFFDGMIDEVAIYNRALTAAEVQKHYNETANAVQMHVRSCENSDCSDGTWSPVYNSTITELEQNNRYFQYKTNMTSIGTQTPKLSEVEINYGSMFPEIDLFGPNDNSGDNDGNVTFTFNVSDDGIIENCSLVIDDVINTTNSSIIEGQHTNFTLQLDVGSYAWYIQCTDDEKTTKKTDIRFINIIYTSNYNSTDLSGQNAGSISNFYVENSEGRIDFSGTVNLSGGVNLDEVINISYNYAYLDSSAEQRLNTTATLMLYGLPYNYQPVVFSDGTICLACTILSYVAGDITFTVPHFSEFTTGTNSELGIWDDTDNQAKSSGQQIYFYANYTNRTSGNPIDDADCTIDFNTTGFTPVLMQYNDTFDLFIYNRSFASLGDYFWNVTCNRTGYETLNLTDPVNVSLDLNLTVLNITFSPTDPVEGEQVTVNVNISNYGTQTADNFTVELNTSVWNGTWKHEDTQQSSEKTLTNGTMIVTFSWTADIGTHKFEAYVDNQDNVTEQNETDNTYSTNLTVDAWCTLYGKYSNYIRALRDSDNHSLTEWEFTPADGNIYFADADADFEFSNLEALNASGDLVQADQALGMTNFTDSLSSLYDPNEDGLPDNTQAFNISGRTIQVPVIDSGTGSVFVTGVLWDGADGAEYTGNEDLVFVTNLNGSQAGTYGTYDYEVRLPSTLENLKESSDFVKRYDEI